MNFYINICLRMCHGYVSQKSVQTSEIEGLNSSDKLSELSNIQVKFCPRKVIFPHFIFLICAPENCRMMIYIYLDPKTLNGNNLTLKNLTEFKWEKVGDHLLNDIRECWLSLSSGAIAPLRGSILILLSLRYQSKFVYKRDVFSTI